MRLDRSQIEVIDQAVADVLQRKTPADPLAIASGIRESVRTMLLTQPAGWTQTGVGRRSRVRLPGAYPPIPSS